jgi:hypothetical protein
MGQNIKVGLLVWLLGVIFLFWLHPLYILMLSGLMLALGILVYGIENRGGV